MRLVVNFIFVLIIGLSFSCEKAGSVDKQIENWVKENPEIIMESLMEFQRDQQEASQPKPEMVEENKEQLFASQSSPIKGNPSGKVEIAYFFDFNCGHCARQSKTMNEVLEKRDDVKIVYKNFPVLGPSSELAAKAALAAHQQGKFKEFYEEAYKIREKTPESLKKIAEKIDLDVKKWEADMEGEAVQKEISDNKELASKMNIKGTPFLAIAPDKVFPGRVDQLEQVIESL